MAEFFNIKDITKIDFNKLVSMLPGRNWWNPFGTQGKYINAILRSQKVFLDNNIDSALRIAHFIAQGLIETGFLRYKAENLNYSAEGLMKLVTSGCGRIKNRSSWSPCKAHSATCSGSIMPFCAA
ncbi:MAG: hypothetical protein AAGA22_06405, partial [Pseudomonadota bacterium]